MERKKELENGGGDDDDGNIEEQKEVSSNGVNMRNEIPSKKKKIDENDSVLPLVTGEKTIVTLVDCSENDNSPNTG